MNKIQKLSGILLIVFRVLFVLQPILLIAFWFNPSFWPAYGINLIPDNIQILHSLTALECFYGWLISLLPMALTMLIFYFFIKLFSFYRKGEIFTEKSISYIRNIGIVMLIEQLVGIFYEAILGFVLTFHNPPGHRLAEVSLSTYNVRYIMTAIMVILVSWIMGEAVKLNEEQKYTV